MNLIKTSILSFLATAIKALSGIVINKAIAVIIGPSGIALIGQFQNSIQIFLSLAQGGINAGIVKYTSEQKDNQDELVEYWSAAARVALISSVIISVGILIFSNKLSKTILGVDSYSGVFILLGSTIIFYTLNQFLLSVLNGLREIKLFIKINIYQSICSLIVTTTAVLLYGIHGALYSLVLNQAIIAIILLVEIRDLKIISFTSFFKEFDSIKCKKLVSFSLMALTSVIVGPASLILIRHFLSTDIDIEHAGYWQSMWYMSSIYMMIFTTTLSTYFLPKFSSLESKDLLRKEVIDGLKIIIPLIIVVCMTIYHLKWFIVKVLFSEAFEGMLVLFKWHLIGDVMKIIAWLFSYLLIAKAKTRMFIISELFLHSILVLSSMVFIKNLGFVGVSYAYAFTYILYFLFILVMSKEILFYDSKL